MSTLRSDRWPALGPAVGAAAALSAATLGLVCAAPGGLRSPAARAVTSRLAESLEEAIGTRRQGRLVGSVAPAAQCNGWFEMDSGGQRVRVVFDGCLPDTVVWCPGVEVLVVGRPLAPGLMEADSVTTKVTPWRERIARGWRG